MTPSDVEPPAVAPHLPGSSTAAGEGDIQGADGPGSDPEEPQSPPTTEEPLSPPTTEEPLSPPTTEEPLSPEESAGAPSPPIPPALPPADVPSTPSPLWKDDLPRPMGQTTASSRRRRGRSLPARVGALLALAVVIAAVWLLLQSLPGSGHAKTSAAPAVVKVLIPEGKTRLQIAELASADRLTGSYRSASRRSPVLDPVHYGAPRGTPDLEGFLFPATYEMNVGANVSRLVEEQLLAFKQRFGASEIRRARELNVTPYQLLTIASMVEREAQRSHDRPLIAAVIYNRLHEGMPLGIDASIYYAVELQKGIATYTHELTTAELHIDSPYNTRTHTGLPPTPISNPGMASIEAAAHPAHVPFLYYVAGADGCGEQVFSTTLAQFELDVAAYQAALKNNGGHPPTCKQK